MQGVTTSIEKLPIMTLLQQIDTLHKCPGVPDNDAKLKSSQGYRYMWTENDDKHTIKSIIRSQGCTGGVQSVSMCLSCTKLYNSLSVRNEAQYILHPKTPLVHVPQKKVLVEEVKAARQQNKKLQSLVSSLQKGIPIFIPVRYFVEGHSNTSVVPAVYPCMHMSVYSSYFDPVNRKETRPLCASILNLANMLTMIR